MKKIRLTLTLLLAVCTASLSAQELFVDADFRMYFDNKEFGSCTFAVPGQDIESGTDFAARLTPRIGIRWEERIRWSSEPTWCRTSARRVRSSFRR